MPIVTGNSIVGGYSKIGPSSCSAILWYCSGVPCCDSSHWCRQTSDKSCPSASLIFRYSKKLQIVLSLLTKKKLQSCSQLKLLNFLPSDSSWLLFTICNTNTKELLILRKLLFSSANCFLSAYHGHLTSLIDISPYKFRNLEGQKEWVHVVCTSAYTYQLLVNWIVFMIYWI